MVQYFRRSLTYLTHIPTTHRALILCSTAICMLIFVWQLTTHGETTSDGVVGNYEEWVKLKTPIIESKEVVRQDELDIQALDQKDKKLIYYVRSHHIFLPSVLEYSFGKDMKLDYESTIYPFFKNKTNGFFIEVGAFDGITYSHTLMLERDYKWNGLLIECNPQLLPKLKSVNRKAYISDVCLSSTNHPLKMQMTSMDKWLASSSLGSGDLYPHFVKSNFTKYEVQTIPLYTIIASIDVKVVDLLVLDVQSLELEVVKYFPFDLILVKVWLLETYFFNKEQKDGLVKFMASKGYPENRVIRTKGDYDFVFVHSSLD